MGRVVGEVGAVHDFLTLKAHGIMTPTKGRAPKNGQGGGHTHVELMRECRMQVQGVWWSLEGGEGSSVVH